MEFRCSSRIASSSSSDVLPLILRVFCVIQMILERTMSTRCRFPVSWKGQYFQSGLGVVTIRDSLMTTKGTCVEQSKDYFLIDNRENQCYQCLLMISRHQNIIQYKESFCLIPDTLTRVCAQIHVETPLYTLVRDPALPVPCPFEEAYYFNYNDHQSGLCGQPISYAKPCVGHTKYLLHFKHCVESATWNGKDIDFECVATWKDGSESYLYVRLKASTVSLKDEQYRCLKYLSYGSEVYMSMSADATCRGLRSPNDGPFVLTLIRDEFGWPSAACLFPDWLKGITWKDLDGRRVYSFDEKGSVVQEFLRRKSSAKRQLQSESRCSKLIDNSREPETEVTVYSSTTHGCISKQQCLKFTQRADNVIELYQGVAVDQLPVAECHFGHNEKPALVLIPEYESVVTCPLTYGLFAFSTNTGGGCVYRLRSICANDTRQQQQQSLEPCDGNKDVFLECLCTWNDSGKTYIATRKPTSSFASIRQERCTSSTSETKPKSGTTTKDKEKQPSTIDRALLSLIFHRLDNSDIFLNETTFNGSVQIPSSTSLKPATTATLFEVFSTPTVAAPRSTAPRREAPGGVGVPEEKIDSDSSVMIPRSDDEEEKEEEVPAPLLPRQTVGPSVEDEEEEDSLDDDEDDFDVSGGSPKTDSEGSSDYERASTASSPSAVARGTRAPPPPPGQGQGQPVGQGKGGRLTNIYDSDRVSSSSSSSSSQSDTDFQFALIYNGGGGTGGGVGGGGSAETGLPRQRHQQPQKNLPTLYDYDENNHRAGQQHPGLASAVASASQSPYSPGNPQLSPDWASSQPRSSPNRSSSVQFFCLRRLSSRLGWTTIVTLASVVAVLFFTS